MTSNFIYKLHPKFVVNYLRKALIEFNFLKFRLAFLGALQNCEKRLLALPRQVCLSVRVSAWNIAAFTRCFSLNLIFEDFMKNVEETPVSLKSD
jgi:hypothetical protein